MKKFFKNMPDGFILVAVYFFATLVTEIALKKIATVFTSVIWLVHAVWYVFLKMFLRFNFCWFEFFKPSPAICNHCYKRIQAIVHVKIIKIAGQSCGK